MSIVDHEARPEVDTVKGLSFGITSIDKLVHQENLCYGYNDEPFVACVAGPDGVGKSIIAMHAASVYASTRYPESKEKPSPTVIYASTDLNFAQANTSWHQFGLHRPGQRRNILREKLDYYTLNKKVNRALENRDSLLLDYCKLTWVSPHSSVQAIDGKESPLPFQSLFDCPASAEPSVFFLDLARFSAGDDWGLLNRTVGLLKDRDLTESTVDSQISRPHLMVVDAVEGLEAMVGDLDGFGLERSRRSRLAQLVRISRKVGCSIIFIIEQQKDDIHLDEVFVSDLVIRLRSTQTHHYFQKTIEIEKARSVPHIRGEHDITLRTGRGCQNDALCPDDPKLSLNDLSSKARVEINAPACELFPPVNDSGKVEGDAERGLKEFDGMDTMAYVQVLPGLDVRETDTVRVRARQNEESLEPTEISNGEVTDSALYLIPNKWFGIPELDRLLRRWRKNPDTPVTKNRKSRDIRDRMTVSLGESGTLKSRLGYAFLAHAFPSNSTLSTAHETVESPRSIDTGKPEQMASEKAGAILFTTETITKSQLLNAMAEWGRDTSQLSPGQIVVRPLPHRFLSSSSLLYRVRQCIRSVKKEIGIYQEDDERAESYRIRFVIDNWSSLLDSHHALREDPQLLQALLALLHDEGVLAHFITTQPGSPTATEEIHRPHDLADLEIKKVYTWPVNFFGTRRIATTTSLSSTSDRRTLIYELRLDKGRTAAQLSDEDEKRDLANISDPPQDVSQSTEVSSDLPGAKEHLHFKLKADRHFALYEALEQGTPRRVDLKVKLYGGYHDDVYSASGASTACDGNSYTNDVSALFGDLFPNSSTPGDVVEFESIERYDGFKDYVQNLDVSQLNNTLVFQVDEFWTDDDNGSAHVLADMSDYLNEVTAELDSTDDTWQPTENGSGDREFVPTSRQIERLARDSKDEFTRSAAFSETSTFKSPRSSGAVAGQSHFVSTRRVPLHRDFGFILADRNAWWEARNEPIIWWAESTEYKVGGTPFFGLIEELNDDPKVVPYSDFALNESFENFYKYVDGSEAKPLDYENRPLPTVADVWNALCVPGDEFPKKVSFFETPFQSVSWMVFFAACRTISARTRKPSFDVDLRTRETLASLVLEIWFSRIADIVSIPDSTIANKLLLNNLDAVRENLLIVSDPEMTSDKNPKWSLVDWAKQTYPWFYQSVQSLIGFLPTRYSSTEGIQLGRADTNSIAFRTWYAPSILSQQENRNLAPLRLPGRFTTQGHWHLGIASGSRSLLLANRAIDKLVSKEMNLKRLREGVGLPVRWFEEIGQVETALTIPDRATNGVRKLEYREIAKMEQRFVEMPKELNLGVERWRCLSPVYRSRIKRYDRDSLEFCLLLERLFQKIPPTEFMTSGFFSQHNIGDSLPDFDSFWSGSEQGGQDGESFHPLESSGFDRVVNQITAMQMIDEDPEVKLTLSFFLQQLRQFCLIAEA